MSKSITISLETAQTVGSTPNVKVADTTTSALYVRRYVWNGSAFEYAAEYSGNSLGLGTFQFDLPNGIYQCWKSANPDNTSGNRVDRWHGGSGKYRWIGDGEFDASVITSGELGTARVPSLAISKITNLQDTLDDKASLTGTNAFEGSNSFQQPIIADYADYDLDTGTDHMITNARLAAYVSGITGYQQAPRTLRVNPNLTAVAGKVYTSILAAVNYASSQSPSENNQWSIIIESMQSGSSSIVAASGSLVNYVNLICALPTIKVLVVGDSITANCICHGGIFVFGGGDANGSSNARTLQNITFEECQIHHYKNMTFKGGALKNNITFKTATSYTATFDKNASNVYPVFEGGSNIEFRIEPVITDRDSWLVNPLYQVRPDLIMPDDPTVSS